LSFAGERPDAFKPESSPDRLSQTIEYRSPPIPQLIGSTTPSTALAAMAASTAEPPCSRIRIAAALARALAALKRELLGEGPPPARIARLGLAVDASAAATALLALSPAGPLAPLAVLGPVLIGLARLTAQTMPLAPQAVLTDRGVLLALLALAAAFGLLPHAAALFSLVLLGGLLLPQAGNRG
jgi:hypothetical protein